MKQKIFLIPLLLIFFLIASSNVIAQDDDPYTTTDTNAVVGSGFSYQGYLEDASGPVNDTCDVRFTLYGSLTGTDLIGSSFTEPGVEITDGVFTVPSIDFGVTAFNGEERYLRIGVRCPTITGTFEYLTPRQPVTPFTAWVTESTYSVAHESVPAVITTPVNTTSAYAAACAGVTSSTHVQGKAGRGAKIRMSVNREQNLNACKDLRENIPLSF